MSDNLNNLTYSMIIQPPPVLINLNPQDPRIICSNVLNHFINNPNLKLSKGFVTSFPINADFNVEFRIVPNPAKKVKLEASDASSSPNSTSEEYEHLPSKRADHSTSSSPKCLKTHTEKCSMTQNYLPLTVQYFGNWIKGIARTNTSVYIIFLNLIEYFCVEVDMSCSELEDKIYSYLTDKIIGKHITANKSSKKNKASQNSEKKKITNKREMKDALTPLAADDKVVNQIKRVLNYMLIVFFEWPNYMDYLFKSKAGFRGKMFLFLNRDEIRRNMTELNPSTPKFYKLSRGGEESSWKSLKKKSKPFDFNKINFETFVTFYKGLMMSVKNPSAVKIEEKSD